MLSAADSPARISQWLARALGSEETVLAYGRSSPASFATYDRDTQFWKTFQRCLVEDLETYSETWPRSGMTRSGIAYQLPTLAPLTDEIESGSWPTPTATLGKNGGLVTPRKAREGGTLIEALSARIWATPTVKGNYNRAGISAKSGDGLATQVGGPLNPQFVEWLMGYPLEWTALPVSEMPSSRRSRKSSGEQS
jgi:hypothetical protein